jgi:hypothetical protein
MTLGSVPIHQDFLADVAKLAFGAGKRQCLDPAALI